MVTVPRLSQFESAVTGGYYRIDRTPYILKYEKANQPFFICLRPAGLDKVLFLSMLRTYYAIDSDPIKRNLFRELYIYQHLTPLFGSFYTLYLDFSSIELSTTNSTIAGYQTEISKAVFEFQTNYGFPLKSEIAKSPSLTLHAFFKTYGHLQLFVFIHEYQGFQYNVLDPLLNSIDESRCRFNPVIREIYSELKNCQNKRLLDRVFVIGIDDSQNR